MAGGLIELVACGSQDIYYLSQNIYYLSRSTEKTVKKKTYKDEWIPMDSPPKKNMKKTYTDKDRIVPRNYLPKTGD